jgi:hypothetical protein
MGYLRDLMTHHARGPALAEETSDRVAKGIVIRGEPLGRIDGEAWESMY